MSEYRVERIPLDKITWPSQERKTIDPVALASLTETVRIRGVEQAIGVIPNGDRYDGLWGYRRWLASKAAGLAVIPAVIREAPRSEAEMIEIRLLENVSRADLNPIELAEGLARLMETGGLSAAEAGTRVGMSNSHVSKTLPLLRLSEEIRQQILAGKISASAGYSLSQVEDPVQQAELARALGNGEISRDTVAGLVKRIKAKAAAPSSSTHPIRVAAELGEGRTIVMSGAGITSLEVMIQWLEELLAKARKARPQGIETKTFVKMLKDQASQTKTMSLSINGSK